MRVDEPMLNADGTECCGNAATRGRVCQYHEGWLDAEEVSSTVLLAQARNDAMQARIARLVEAGDALAAVLRSYAVAYPRGWDQDDQEALEGWLQAKGANDGL